MSVTHSWQEAPCCMLVWCSTAGIGLHIISICIVADILECTVLDLKLNSHYYYSCFVGVALVANHRENRTLYKLCLLMNKMFVKHAPDYIAACWRPPLTLLCGHCCVHQVIVTWSYREQVGRLVTGLSLLLHPVHGICCRPTWNSCARPHLSRGNWRAFCLMLLTLWTLTKMTGMCHQSCCTSGCCYWYCVSTNWSGSDMEQGRLNFVFDTGYMCRESQWLIL